MEAGTKIAIVFFVLTIVISIIISNHFSQKTDQTLDEIKNISVSHFEIGKETLSKIDLIGDFTPRLTPLQYGIYKKDPANPEIRNILEKQKEKCREELFTKYKDTVGISEIYKRCDLVIIKPMDFTPRGTTLQWLSFRGDYSRIEEKAYISDIGDSDINDRVSLYIDNHGFLVWKIYQSNFNSVELKHNISKLLKTGEKFALFLMWDQSGNLKMNIGTQTVSELKIEDFKLNISSQELFVGSDINGLHKLEFPQFN
ncbi:MAG: hypothetical protein KAT43_03805 [Nanoarchaeota archaeon]|nr:hypothetical protein [Nanoarchaeota archaeon]